MSLLLKSHVTSIVLLSAGILSSFVFYMKRRQAKKWTAIEEVSIAEAKRLCSLSQPKRLFLTGLIEPCFITTEEMPVTSKGAKTCVLRTTVQRQFEEVAQQRDHHQQQQRQQQQTNKKVRWVKKTETVNDSVSDVPFQINDSSGACRVKYSSVSLLPLVKSASVFQQASASGSSSSGYGNSNQSVRLQFGEFKLDIGNSEAPAAASAPERRTIGYNFTEWHLPMSSRGPMCVLGRARLDQGILSIDVEQSSFDSRAEMIRGVVQTAERWQFVSLLLFAGSVVSFGYTSYVHTTPIN